MDVIKELRPIFTSMSLVGLYHAPCFIDPTGADPATEENDDNQESRDRSSNITSESRRPRATWYRRGSRYYCLFVCFLMWFQFIRFVVSFWASPEYQPNMSHVRISVTFFYLQGALNATLMYRACRNSNQLLQTAKILSNHCRKYPISILTPPQSQRLKKQVIIVQVVLCTFALVECAVQVFVHTEWRDDFIAFSKLFTDPFGLSIPSKTVSLILNVFAVSALLFPINLLTGFFCSLCSRFKTLSMNLGEVISRANDSYPAELEIYRIQHNYLCAYVRVLDGALGKLIFANYATNLPMVCFLVYQLFTDYNYSELAICGLVLISSLFSSFSASLTAASVHEEAHSPLGCLYDVNTAGATQEQLMQLHLFLSRVSGAVAIGFSPLGIVTITKETILSLCSILVTYFLILIQYPV